VAEPEEKAFGYADAHGCVLACEECRETDIRPHFFFLLSYIIIIITITAKYLLDSSGCLEIFGGYLEHFLRISENIFGPFFESIYI